MSSKDYADPSKYGTGSFEEKEVGHADGKVGGKEYPQITSNNTTNELSVTKAISHLIPCKICRTRRVPFMPAFYCHDCTVMWFMTGDECQMQSEALWHRKGDEKYKLTPLELERIQWNIDPHNQYLLTNWSVFIQHIEKEKPELVEQIPQAIKIRTAPPT